MYSARYPGSGRLQFLDSDVAELDSGAVAKQTNVAFGVGDAARAFGPAHDTVCPQELFVLHTVQVAIIP